MTASHIPARRSRPSGRPGGQPGEEEGEAQGKDGFRRLDADLAGRPVGEGGIGEELATERDEVLPTVKGEKSWLKKGSGRKRRPRRRRGGRGIAPPQTRRQRF